MSWWPAPTCSTPAATAARSRSVPSCPVAPRMSSRSEDGIVLHRALQNGALIDPTDAANAAAIAPASRVIEHKPTASSRFVGAYDLPHLFLGDTHAARSGGIAPGEFFEAIP